jgi:hypothetical protein
VRAVGCVALATVFGILSGGAFFTPQLATAANGGIRPLAAWDSIVPDVVPAGADARDGDDAADPGDAFTDLYGNEVSDAIATYSLDPSGSLYELHSPQTELPRLGIPKS